MKRPRAALARGALDRGLLGSGVLAGVLAVIAIARAPTVRALTVRTLTVRTLTARAGGQGAPTRPVPVQVDGRAPGANGGPLGARLRDDVVALDSALAGLPRCAGRGTGGAACAARAFADARAAYKRQEALVELLAPAAATALNGRRQEVDDDDAAPPGATASAFAAVERALAAPAPDWRAAAEGVRGGREAVHTLLAQLGDFRISPPLVFEAAQLEVARVATLGVTGFDTPDTRAGVGESAVALRGAAALVAATVPAPAAARAVASLERAARYAATRPDFARFDRLTFIADYTEPALRELERARRSAGVPRVERPRAWTGTTLFERGAFDVRAYAPEAAPRATPALVALGARLFADPALSGDGSRACASCHVPARAFADGRRAPAVVRGVAGHVAAGGVALRNTPSLLAVAYEPALFADARAVTLEDQAAAVLASAPEMGSSAERAAARVAREPTYAAAFRGALGAAPTPLGVRQALAAYVRSLGRTESRVDRAFRGDRGALTAEERRGASLFLGRAGCGTCHYAPLFSGATPPLFRSVDAEVLGVPAVGARRVDPDPGRGAVDGRPEHLHAFKTPTLRNVARTAPYMHNGAFATLDAVVRFYDDGGGRGRGLRVPNQTLPARRLQLTVDERRALVAFLRALNDEPGSAVGPSPPTVARRDTSVTRSSVDRDRTRRR